MECNEYFDEIVEPTIAEFAANPTSRRHAFLACVATFHAIDYLAASRSARNTGNLKERFRGDSAEFGVVDRVAHAFKHVNAYPKAPANKRLASGEVVPRPPGRWDAAVWDLSRWDDPVGGVTLDPERTVDLLATVRAAARFVQAQSNH